MERNSENVEILSYICTHQSHYIISYQIISNHIKSYHIISYHIISYHIISYHIISYHSIPYHIISCHIIQNKINRTLNFATFSDRISSLSPHQSAGSFFRELKDVGSSGTAFRSVEENQKYVEWFGLKEKLLSCQWFKTMNQSISKS